MALDVKLVERDDLSTGDTSALALTNFTNGIALRRDAWVQQIANTQQPIAESLQLTLKGATATPDALATVAQALDAKVTVINDSKRNPAHGVWLRTRAGETHDRQAFITSVPDKRAANVHGVKAITQGIAEAVPFAFSRMPYWEATTAVSNIVYTADYTLLSSGESGLFGRAMTLGAFLGDVPARLARLTITPGNITRAWLGFIKTGVVLGSGGTDFQAECEAGDLYNSTTVVGLGGSSGYSQNNIARCTFADASMLLRCAAKIDSTPSVFPRGTYQVLLRARVSDGTTKCMVRLADGYLSDTYYSYRNRVLISGTNPLFYPLGTIQVPAVYGSPVDALAGYRMFIEASRYEGAGNLDLDVVVLVPMTYGYVFIDQMAGGTVIVNNLPDGRWEAHQSDGSKVTRLLAVAADGGIPIGPEEMVVCVAVGDRGTISVLDDTAAFRLDAYERYRTLRGAA